MDKRAALPRVHEDAARKLLSCNLGLNSHYYGANDDWLTDFYWTLLQPKGWIAKYNMYTKIENTNNRK